MGFNRPKKGRDIHGNEKMDNLTVEPNDKGLVTSEYPDTYPCTDHLFDIKCAWNVGDKKRSYCLIIEDMEKGYEQYVRHCIPQVKMMIKQFREMKLPIIWTNWSRQAHDPHESALDRFYGYQGIKDELNPCYVYGPQATETVDELAPVGEDELSRTIVSMHLSKFADYDEDGREILFPMLEAWGVNTLI